LTDPVTLNSYWSFLKNRKLLIKGKAGQWTGGGFFTAFADERPMAAPIGDIDNEDGDGLYVGEEDSNFNGRVGEGETGPRRRMVTSGLDT
jgi:hypothetical protein